MFEKIKERVKNFLEKKGADTGLGKQFKSIFEVGGVPAFNQFYYFGIFIWKYLYKGYYRPWHLLKVTYPTGRKGFRNMATMGMAKAVCAEMASMIWSEQCDVHVSQEGDTEQVLDEFVHDVLKKNGFWEKMQGSIEQGLALGGGAIKAWYAEDTDSQGNPVPGSGRIRLGYAMADQFIPTGWDNAKVNDAVFVSRQAKDGYYYTRLEWHKWDGLTYYIENQLYRSEQAAGDQQNIGYISQATESQDILGFRYPLNEIYPFLNEKTAIQGLTTSLFAYWHTAVANNMDDNSPLGVSIYANAMDTLRNLDICYDSFIREFQLGKKRIIVPAQALRTIRDPETGAMCRYFDETDEVFEALATDTDGALQIKDNSVSLRVDEHIAAINAFLNTLCLQLGFSAGTFTFDKSQGVKTATEVISENSKTYKTIKSNQSQIKYAIEDIVNAIIELGSLYDLKYKGHSIRQLAARGWESKVFFDDSILQDRQTNINEGIMLMSNGVMSKRRFITDILGFTDEEAQQELEQIAKEQNITADIFDLSTAAGIEGATPDAEPEADEEKAEEAEDES